MSRGLFIFIEEQQSNLRNEIRTLLWITTVLVSFTAKGQFNETIRTGRPGQAIGPFAVGRNVFQAQTGFDFGGGSNKNANFSGNNIAPNTVLRFGLAEHFELNSAWEYRSDKYSVSDSAYSTAGLSLATLGTRINLLNGKKAVPSIGLQLSFKLPILSAAYNPRYIAPKALLIITEKISEAFSALANIGIDYDGNTPGPAGVYVFNIGYSISPKWSTFVEAYGSVSGNTLQAKWDTGLAYLCNNNLQLDIYGGMSGNAGLTEYFTSIGVSYRVLASRTNTK